MSNVRYRVKWPKHFDEAVGRVAEREGLSMEQFIQAAVALYGALSNMAKSGSKFLIHHADGTVEQFIWEKGTTEEVKDDDRTELSGGREAQQTQTS